MSETQDIITRLRTACSPESPLGKLCSEAADILAERQRSNWQPIETAPRDGTEILVWRPKEDAEHPAHVGVDYWSEKFSDWYRTRPGQRPTHWQPLPAAPTQPTVKED